MLHVYLRLKECIVLMKYTSDAQLFYFRSFVFLKTLSLFSLHRQRTVNILSYAFWINVSQMVIEKCNLHWSITREMGKSHVSSMWIFHVCIRVNRTFQGQERIKRYHWYLKLAKIYLFFHQTVAHKHTNVLNVSFIRINVLKVIIYTQL